MWMILFLLLPLAGLAYVGWHIFVLVPLSVAWRWVLIAFGVGSFLLLFANISRAIDSLPLPLARCAYDVGCSSLFILLYLVMLFLLLDLGRLLRLVPREWVYNNFYTTVIILVGMFVLFLYANVNYHHKVRRQIDITTDKALERPLKLLLMSDLHLGYHNPRSELARWVDMVNSEHPDMVLIAGDIIDGSMRPLVEENMAQEFLRIKAPVYACLGNHEYYAGEPLAQQFYRDANIHLLCDTFAVVGDVCIIGRDDRTNQQRKTLDKLVSELPLTSQRVGVRLLLDHQPYNLEQAEHADIDFQFSGHTHYGQVWPISWIEDATYECAYGAHRRGHTQYYVTSGIGIWGGKFRIGTRSEYVVLTIRSAG